jgi:kumamolisin
VKLFTARFHFGPSLIERRQEPWFKCLFIQWVRHGKDAIFLGAILKIHFINSGLTVAAILAMNSIASSQEPLVVAKGAPDVHNFEHSRLVLDKSKRIRVSLSLAGFNLQGADALIKSQSDPNSPNFHHWIKAAEFAKRFGPSDFDTKTVTDFLSNNGFKEVKVAASKTFISATGTFGIAEKAFHTHLAHFVRPASHMTKGDPETFYGPTEPVMLPRSVSSKVDGVFGLCNLALMHPNLVRSKVKKTSSTEYGPATFTLAYDSYPLTGKYQGVGQKIAIFSPTLRNAEDPINFVVKLLGKEPQFTSADIYPDGIPPSQSADGNGEAALDQEVCIGQAPQITMLLFSPNTGTGSIQDYSTAELVGYDTVEAFGDAPVLTSSWDLNESDVIAAGQSSYSKTFTSVCAALAAQGVTIFNSSGDAAAYTNSGTGAVSTKLETSCPYLTSVGGTNLRVTTSAPYWDGESLWAFSGTKTSPEGGGGGYSKLVAKPSWQTGPGVHNGNRQVPDVSADADPNTGYIVWENGEADAVGGTSAATPLWAINTVLMEAGYAAALKVNPGNVYLGLLNPGYYQLGNWYSNPAVDYPPSEVFYVYHDITQGSNGVFGTTADYDPASGWGSADFYKMYLDLGDYLKVPGIAPDLKPYNPGNVSGLGDFTSPIMLSTSASTLTVPSSIVHGTKYYAWVCRQNASPADCPACTLELELNAKLVSTFPVAALDGNDWDVYTAPITFTTAGVNKVGLVVNYGNTVNELSTANNSYTLSVTVK